MSIIRFETTPKSHKFLYFHKDGRVYVSGLNLKSNTLNSFAAKKDGSLCLVTSFIPSIDSGIHSQTSDHLTRLGYNPNKFELSENKLISDLI